MLGGDPGFIQLVDVDVRFGGALTGLGVIEFAICPSQDDFGVIIIKAVIFLRKGFPAFS